MRELNLPHFEFKLSEIGAKQSIFDPLRKKFVILTPEEWVRQHFIHYLISKGYPKSLIKVEGGLQFNNLPKRSDILIYDRSGNPWMLVECKSPDISIGEKTLQQASMYNATIKASYLTVTNGLQHFYFTTDWLNRTTAQLETIPEYPK